MYVMLGGQLLGNRLEDDRLASAIVSEDDCGLSLLQTVEQLSLVCRVEHDGADVAQRFALQVSQSDLRVRKLPVLS